jgi:hypothetical protein
MAVTVQIAIQVVGDQEQHIGLAGLGGNGRGVENQNQDKRVESGDGDRFFHLWLLGVEREAWDSSVPASMGGCQTKTTLRGLRFCRVACPHRAAASKMHAGRDQA